MRLSHSGNGATLAFTLVELMVVCVIIGIMSAVVVAEMRGSFEDVLLRSSGRKLINGFSLAYSRAVSFNHTYRVRLDRAGSRFVVEEEVREGSKGMVFHPVRDLAGGDGALDARVSVHLRKGDGENRSDGATEGRGRGGEEPGSPAEGESVSFYADGTAEAAEVVLRDREGFRLALRVNPVTGRVRISELDRE